MMRKYIILLLLIIIGLAVYAEDTDWSDPDQVNAANPADVASAIKSGKVSTGVVSDTQLSKAVASDPSIASSLKDGDLARAISSDSSLMGKVFEEVKTRISNNPGFANSNPAVLDGFYKQYGISNEGRIQSYDGKNVKTSGSQSTTFDPAQFKGAKVLSDGQVVLADGKTEVSGSVLTTGPDGNIIATGGSVNIPPGGNTPIQSDGAIVKYGDFVFSGQFKITPGKDGPVVEGNFNEVNLNTGKVAKTVNGRVTYQSSDRRIIHANTEITLFENGAPDITYKVTKDTELATSIDPATCKMVNCIWHGELSSRIFSKDNKVDVTVHKVGDDRIFVVAKPTGGQVDISFLGENGNVVGVISSREKRVVTKGDISGVKATVLSEIGDIGGSNTLFLIRDGVMQGCTDDACKSVGIGYSQVSDVDKAKISQGSVVKMLDAANECSSFACRKELYNKYFPNEQYSGSPAQNLKLLEAIPVYRDANGKLSLGVDFIQLNYLPSKEDDKPVKPAPIEGHGVTKDKGYGSVTAQDIANSLGKKGDCVSQVSGLSGIYVKDGRGDLLLPAVGDRMLSADTKGDLSTAFSGLDVNKVYVAGLGQDYPVSSSNPYGMDIRHVGFLYYSDGQWNFANGGYNHPLRNDEAAGYFSQWSNNYNSIYSKIPVANAKVYVYDQSKLNRRNVPVN